jgi:hypothetical protein
MNEMCLSSPWRWRQHDLRSVSILPHHHTASLPGRSRHKSSPWKHQIIQAVSFLWRWKNNEWLYLELFNDTISFAEVIINVELHVYLNMNGGCLGKCEGCLNIHLGKLSETTNTLRHDSRYRGLDSKQALQENKSIELPLHQPARCDKAVMIVGRRRAGPGQASRWLQISYRCVYICI